MPDPTPAPDPGPATRILRASLERGPEGSAELLRLLYDELHRMADRQMAAERGGHTLQPTALLHEAWMKLFAGATDTFDDRNHFLATAARAMRQILVDHARARARDKRGGGRERVELPEQIAGELVGDVGGANGAELDLIEVDRALEELRRRAPRHARIVECRFFADLSVEETAAALGISPRTVAREWRFARAWLSSSLGRRGAGEDPGAGD